LVFEVNDMPETKMLDKRRMNEQDPNRMKDEITGSEPGAAGKQADPTDEKRGEVQGNEGSTCSGRDPYVPKNPVKKESEK
jgi:hypothetical protein